jgi:hypothetical protein
MRKNRPPKDDGHHHGHDLAISHKDIKELRAGDPGAEKHVLKVLEDAVREDHGGHFRLEDIEEVARSALADAWKKIKERRARKHVLVAFQQGIWRHRRRLSRHFERQSTGRPAAFSRPVFDDPAGRAIMLDHVVSISRLLHEHYLRALSRMPDVAHDLVLRAYDLERRGIARRLPHPVVIRPSVKHDKAVAEACEMFNSYVMDIVVGDLCTGRGDPKLLGEALEVLRGDIDLSGLRLTIQNLNDERDG